MAGKYFKLEGKEKLILQIQSIPVQIDDGVTETLKIIGTKAQEELRAILQDGNGFPEEPGLPPHTQTGNLRKNIFARLDPRYLGREITLTVGVLMKGFYGHILEYGANRYPKRFKRLKHTAGAAQRYRETLGLSYRLLPRPWYWPIMEKFMDDAPGKIEGAINKVLKKYA